LTKQQGEPTCWSLVDAYVSVVTQANDAVRRCLVFTVMHYCLPIGQFVKTKPYLVYFSYVALDAP